MQIIGTTCKRGSKARSGWELKISWPKKRREPQLQLAKTVPDVVGSLKRESAF